MNTGACDDLRRGLRPGPRARRRGCTSTARSGCGPPPARPPGSWSTASSSRTPGPATVTSGSMFRTTRASRSAPTPTCMRRRCPTPPRTWSAPAARRAAGGPHARVLTPGTRFRRVGRTARAGPRRGRGAGRPLLRAGPPVRRGAAAAGVEVANDVVLNQVLVGFGDDARTDAVDRRRCRRRHLLGGRHDLARTATHADLGVQRHDDRGRRRPVGRRDHPPRRLTPTTPCPAPMSSKPFACDSVP